jgi:hypothetical protein
MAEKKAHRPQNKTERKNLVDRRRLGELLVETGLLTREKLKDTLEAQKGSGKRLGQILIEKDLISEEEIAFALAMQLKIPFMDLTDYPIQTEVIEVIPEHVCRRFHCIPIDKTDNVLHVSMADPLDLNMMKELQFVTGLSIQPTHRYLSGSRNTTIRKQPLPMLARSWPRKIFWSFIQRKKKLKKKRR